LPPPSQTKREKSFNVAETLAVAAAGGCTLGLLGVPAGWLSGATLAVAAAALAGRPMYMPLRLAQVIFVFIGISLGGVVTPATLQSIAAYPFSVVTLLVVMVATAAAAALYLERVHGWDRTSAFLGSAPGALSQVIATAAELGAELRGIAIVQSVRVVMLAIALPAGLVLLGQAGPAARLGGELNIGSLDQLALLVAVSAAVAVLVHAVHFPGGLLFGSMVASAALHGSGYIDAVMPWWAANIAMMALGAVTGSRFAGTTMKTLLRFALAAFGTLAVSVAISAAGALLLVALSPLRIADVMIAFAPGAADAMMLLALALSVDPVYVGAHHLTRIFFVAFLTPIVARSMHRRSPRRIDKKKLPPIAKPPFQD